MTIDLEELKRLAGNIVSRYEWVTEDWAFQHFGSEMEAKFVVAASPSSVLELIRLLENTQFAAQKEASRCAELERENQRLRGNSS